jgi:hypothetical protein
MSQWTHVVGSISADCHLTLFSGVDPTEIAKTVTGRWENESLALIKYEPNSLENQKSYGSGPIMPSGSEGPLLYVANRIGTKFSTNNLLVTFWANLRDYGEKDVQKELIPYFSTLVKRYEEKGISIRNMAVEIDIEFGSRYILNMKQRDDYEQPPEIQITKPRNRKWAQAKKVKKS